MFELSLFGSVKSVEGKGRGGIDLKKKKKKKKKKPVWMSLEARGTENVLSEF